MMKSIVGIASFTALLAIAPMQAQAACTEAAMTKMEGETATMKDAKAKEGAMKEVMMAKEAMGKKDEAGCATHMENAMKMMPKS